MLAELLERRRIVSHAVRVLLKLLLPILLEQVLVVSLIEQLGQVFGAEAGQGCSNTSDTTTTLVLQAVSTRVRLP